MSNIKITDESQIEDYVQTVLGLWKKGGDESINFVRVNSKEARFRMNNTASDEIPDLINDTLSLIPVVEEYGIWVYTDYDHPFGMFIRLPHKSTILDVNLYRLNPQGYKTRTSLIEVDVNSKGPWDDEEE